jgi:hypothetical protein
VLVLKSILEEFRKKLSRNILVSPIKKGVCERI